MDASDGGVTERSNATGSSLGVIWGAAFAVAFTLYLVTASHDVGWQDSGFQQLRIVTGQLNHERGLALAHPVQFYLGRMLIRIPSLEPAFAITLASVLGGAVTIANLLSTLVVLTRRVLLSAMVAAALMLSHTLWQHATHTESYALLAALLTGEWLCLACYAHGGRRSLLLLLALLNGLGVATHLMATLALPVDALVVLWAWRTRRLSGRMTFLVGVCWIVGTLPYSLLVLSAGLQSGDWGATIHSALFGKYAGEVLNTGLSIQSLGRSLGYLCYNLPNLIIPAAIYAFWARGDHPRLFVRAAAFQLLIFAMFVVRYTVVDQYAFFFPVYLLIALFAGLGLNRAVNNGSPRVRRLVLTVLALTVVGTPLVYVASSSVLASRGMFASLVAAKPYRNGYTVFFEPWGIGENHGRKVNAKVAELAGDNGLVLDADGMIQFAVRYAQAVGRIPKEIEIRCITITSTPEAAEVLRSKLQTCIAQGRPVVLIPRDRDHPRTSVTDARWLRQGDLYVLQGIGGDALQDDSAGGGATGP